LLASFDPGAHDLCGEPVSSDFGFGYDGHAVAAALRVGSSGEEERGDVGVQGFAGLDVTVVFDVDGVAEKRRSVSVVVLDVVAGIEQVT
jgi:hypothetical protein